MNHATDAWVNSPQLGQSGDYLTPCFLASEGDPSGTGSGLTASNTGVDPGHCDQRSDGVPGLN